MAVIVYRGIWYVVWCGVMYCVVVRHTVFSQSISQSVSPLHAAALQRVESNPNLISICKSWGQGRQEVDLYWQLVCMWDPWYEQTNPKFSRQQEPVPIQR